MILIYKEIKNGKIELTKKEFEEYLEQARQEGYNDGYRKGCESYLIIPTKETHENYNFPNRIFSVGCGSTKIN